MDFTTSEKELGIAPFSYIPEFIKANKAKVEEYEGFGIVIWRILFLRI